MNAGGLQFAMRFVVQIEIGLHASECAGDVVYDVVDQLVEIKDGGYLPRPLLQLEEMFDLFGVYGADADGIRDDGLGIVAMMQTP